MSASHASLTDIPAADVAHTDAKWTPVRNHFGITAFGVNAYTARNTGDRLIGEHDHADPTDEQHQELYFVHTGHARFQVSILADEDGQILDAHSISAGLDYPGVGPEHAALRDSGRARYITANSAPEPPDGLDHMRVCHSAIRIGFHALKLSSPSLCGRLRVTA